jgi:hypothetical protein
MRIFRPSSAVLLPGFEDVKIWVIFINYFNITYFYFSNCSLLLVFLFFIIETLRCAWNNRITNWVSKMGPMYHPGFYFDDAVSVSFNNFSNCSFSYSAFSVFPSFFIVFRSLWMVSKDSSQLLLWKSLLPTFLLTFLQCLNLLSLLVVILSLPLHPNRPLRS